MPPEISPNQKPDQGLRPIRTFESDVAEILQKENITKEKIAVAEGKRREKTEISPAPSFHAKTLNLSGTLPTGQAKREIPWRIIAIIAGVLAVIGIGVLIYFGIVWTKEGSTAVTPTQSVPAIPTVRAIVIGKDETRTAVIEKIKKAVADAPVKVNEVRALPLTYGASPMTVEQFLSVLETHAPASLSRAFAPDITLGVHGFRGAQAFLLIPVVSYDRAFTDMLSWEKTLLDDIGTLFGLNIRDLSLSVGTSTTEVLAQDLKLKDAILRNKDARALFDTDGAIVFLYSFLDKQTLLITTSEETLRVLQNKVSGGRLKLPVTQ